MLELIDAFVTGIVKQTTHAKYATVYVQLGHIFSYSICRHCFKLCDLVRAPQSNLFDLFMSLINLCLYMHLKFLLA